MALLIWALTAPFDRRKRVLHLFTCFWASLYTWLNPAWPGDAGGPREVALRSPDRAGRQPPLTAGHPGALPHCLRTSSGCRRSRTSGLPASAGICRLNQYIKIRRGDRASVVQMMRACEATLTAGSSIMMFPEGTRSPQRSHARLQARRLRAGAAHEISDPADPAARQRGCAAQTRLRASGTPPDLRHDLGSDRTGELRRSLCRRAQRSRPQR